ncbi:MAG: bifunctional DNA-formamidopyrimidine glycosylase/DNA-(apurinic or apyrimidinic site) lyase [Gammaproteobacteria bacterium]
MPELPEVETTARGIAPHLVGRSVVSWTLRVPALRWPVDLPDSLNGARIERVARRAKYILIETPTGALIVHLGMSGSLRILSESRPPLRHDHFDLELDDGRVLRFNDPRRFGSLHWQPHPVGRHWLLADLGVEPLDAAFDGAYLKAAATRRRAPVKNFIMDGRMVVGVGNIYAAESLFLSGIRPTRAAGRVRRVEYDRLAHNIRRVLTRSIVMGGTTLRDFVNHDGQPGYFQQSLWVYGREGEACKACGTLLVGLRLGNRGTVYCPLCQPPGPRSDAAWSDRFGRLPELPAPTLA